ncbi:MAG: hypothetical protein HN348_00050 [Proteobacteria bacterium]|jgi:type II secretory pathway component PulK|nr:hypothetical protein [Pseudomonadota bacterium]
MVACIRWIYHELTRPRGHQQHRFYRVGRSSRSGIALLIAITSIMLMTILVTETIHDASVRLQVAAHQRDEAKAELLATSGVRLYQLVLISSKQMGKNPYIGMASQYIGINADSLWQMIPYVDTGLMRMLFVSGEDLQRVNQEMALTDAQVEKSREDTLGTKRNFLDFDGDFSANVIDENRRIDVGGLKGQDQTALLTQPGAVKLLGLMAGTKNDEFFRDADYVREELIGNLADWTDADDVRLYQGGDEDRLYERLDEPYLPKNAPFDTLQEIRLVDGWHLDEVWKRYGQHLTIYGDGKINVNTADRDVIEALLWAYLEVPNEFLIDELVGLIMEYRRMSPLLGGGLFKTPQSFVQFIQQFGVGLRNEIIQGITIESTIFRVKAKGTVSEATVTIEAVFDFTKSPTGKVIYWHIN